MLMRRFRIPLLIGLILLCVVSLGCSGGYEKQVVISFDAKQSYASPILASFARQFPKDEFQVVKRSLGADDFRGASQSNVPAPSKNDFGDVIWNSDVLRTLQWQRQGLLQSRSWAIPTEWPKSFRASNGTWVAFAARARVLLINEQLIDPSAVPTRVLDLGALQWKDKCGIASLASSSVRAHWSTMVASSEAIKLNGLSDQDIATNNQQSFDFAKWADRLAQNAKIYDDEKQVATAVEQGEIHWAIVDSDVAIAASDRNKAIRISFPDQTEDGFGTVLIPGTVSVVADAKNPKVAGRLADFLVSDEVEARLTISDSATIPLNPKPKELSRLLKGLDVKWAEVKLEELVDAWETKVIQSGDKLGSNLRN